MRSTDLQGFSAWHKWEPNTATTAPKLQGVYVFRLAGRSFGRFTGESDIIYIGCAALGTIYGRLSTSSL
jgi:hypothetical protein